MLNKKFETTKTLKVVPKVDYTAKITIPNLAITTNDVIDWNYSFNGIATEVKWYINDVPTESLPSTLSEGSYSVKLEVVNEIGEIYTDIKELNVADINSLSNVKRLIVYGYTSFAIMNDGTVKAWGSNEYGQLGLGDTVNRNTPTVAPALKGVKDIDLGFIHSIAIMSDGTVKAWGLNSSGQLGLGDTTNRVTPTVITSFGTNVSQVYCGQYTSFALMKDGTVMYWGDSGFGELGLGDNIRRLIPTLIADLGNSTKKLFVGGFTTFAMDGTGSVKAWGYNSYGQLGLGDNTSKNRPQPVTSLGSGVNDLSVSSYNGLAITSDGKVKSFGNNTQGQLGLGDRLDRNTPTTIECLGTDAKKVVMGDFTSYVIMKDGTVRAWGENSYGQIGNGDKVIKDIPTITSLPGTDTVDLVAAYKYAVSISSSGLLRAWGNKYYGQLGLGDNADRLLPTKLVIK